MSDIKRNLAIVVVVIGCAIIGVVLILTTHATTPVASVEAEGGNISTPASQVSVTGASGSGAVRFNSSGDSSQTTNCAPPLNGHIDFASVETAVLNNTTSSKCGYPDTTNAGVPAAIASKLYTPTSSTSVPTTVQNCTPTYNGTTLPCDNWGWTFSGGGITINTSNAVVDGVRLTNGGVAADSSSPVISNATIENSNISASSPDGGIVYFRFGSGNTVKYSTIHGIDDTAANTTEYAIENVSEPSFTADHVYLYNCTECASAGTSLTLSNSYLVVNSNVTGAHYEDVYFSGGSFTAQHDTLFNIQNQTASVDTDPTISGLVINNSLLASGNYLVYAGGSTSTNVAVTNNDIVGSFPNGYLTDYDPEGNWPTSAIWSGNFCDSTGLPVLEEGAYYNIHGADTQQCF